MRAMSPYYSAVFNLLSQGSFIIFNIISADSALIMTMYRVGYPRAKAWHLLFHLQTFSCTSTAVHVFVKKIKSDKVSNSMF